MRALVDRLLVVVQASAKRLESVFGADVALRPGYREVLIEVAVVSNAALAAHTLKREVESDAIGGAGHSSAVRFPGSFRALHHVVFRGHSSLNPDYAGFEAGCRQARRKRSTRSRAP